MNNSAFGLICEIDPEDERTWRGRIFLTFDIDWAHDDVISDTIELLEDYGVPATWFITHSTKLIHRLVGNDLFQAGLHPNFNSLLNGDLSNGVNAANVLLSLHEIVPTATAVRSHSLTQNERLVDLFLSNGLTHASNVFIPIGRNIQLAPWRLWGGLTVTPHCWQDNVALRMPLTMPTVLEVMHNLAIFNFHPIHVYLNTEDLDRYERTRHLHQEPGELIKHRYQGYGTRSRLVSLLEQVGTGIPTERQGSRV